MVVLLVVAAVVLYLAARNWRAVAPAAAQVARPGSSVVDAHGEHEAAGEVRSRNLPDLDEMDRRTDSHAADVQDALEAAR
jgi:hypothetical protein